MSAHGLKNQFPSPAPSQREVDDFCSAAAKGDQAAVAGFLDKYAAAIDQRHSSGATALTWAAERVDKAMVRLLLDKGAHIEAQDDVGCTPLIRAAYKGHTDIAALLLQSGASLEAKNRQKRTALMGAALSGRANTVSFLLEKGAAVKGIDVEGRTAVQLSQVWGHPETGMLIEQWLNMQGQLKDGELKHAEIRAREQSAERLEKLKNRRPPKSPLKKNSP